MGDDKTYRDNDSSDYHMIGADKNRHKDGPIFTIVVSKTRVNSFIPAKVGCDQATGREAPKP